MRAFLVAWRTIVTYYNELFFLLGVSLVWWATGGVFVFLAVILGFGLFSGGPWWIAPLAAIPIGPANVAMAVVARRCARGSHVDRGFYFEGLRTYWRQGLAISAIGMAVLALLLLNMLFYMSSQSVLLVTFSLFWGYLAMFSLVMQMFAYPILIGMERPSVFGALRTAGLVAFANPLFSIVLFIVALAFTGISVALAILVLIAWPALIALLGEHAFRLVLIRAGLLKEEDA